MTAALAALLLLASAKERDGIAMFERGEFGRARSLLLEVVDSERIDETDKAAARSYLAASYWALGEMTAAKGQLRELARHHPEHRLDPLLFVPPLVSLAEEIRAGLLREQKPPPPDAPRADPPPALAPPPPPAIGRARAPLAVTSVAAALTAAGAITTGAFALSGKSSFDAYRSQQMQGRVAAADAWSEQEAIARRDTINGEATAALVLGIASGALIAIAVVLLASE